MKIEKILSIALILILSLSVITPVVILTTIKDKMLAGQIGDALGGSSAPFVNISAILVVLITYIYQRRNDNKNSEKELVLEMFGNIRTEFSKVTISETSGSGDQRKKTQLFDKEALNLMLQYLNDGFVSLEKVQEWDPYKSLLHIYKSLDSLLDFIKYNDQFSKSEKNLFISQIGLFYSNNLFIDPHKRGDEYCEHHKKTHDFPLEMKMVIVQIERKISLNEK